MPGGLRCFASCSTADMHSRPASRPLVCRDSRSSRVNSLVTPAETGVQGKRQDLAALYSGAREWRVELSAMTDPSASFPVPYAAAEQQSWRSIAAALGRNALAGFPAD